MEVITTEDIMTAITEAAWTWLSEVRFGARRGTTRPLTTIPIIILITIRRQLRCLRLPLSISSVVSRRSPQSLQVSGITALNQKRTTLMSKNARADGRQ